MCILAMGTMRQAVWVLGQSVAALALLLPAESTRPLLRPLWAFVALGLALIAGSWLWDRRGRS